MAERITFELNGETQTVEVAPDTPLLYVLRNELGLNNPHFGCGLAQCGACTVHVDGAPVPLKRLRRSIGKYVMAPSPTPPGPRAGRRAGSPYACRSGI